MHGSRCLKPLGSCADLLSMQVRTEERWSSTLVPVQIEGMGDLRLDTFGRLLDRSQQGVRVGVLEAVPVGSLLRIELGGSVIWGEVRYCEDQKNWFAIGLVIRASQPVSC